MSSGHQGVAPGRHVVAYIPEAWGEVPRRHLPLFLRVAVGGPDEYSNRLRAIRAITGWPSRRLWQITPTDLWAICDTLSWTQEPRPESPFREVIHNGVTRLTPGDGFEHGTCLQWALAEEYFQQVVSGDDQAVYLLAAVLLRPADDPVRDRKQLEADVKIMRQLKEELVGSLALYFAGVKQYVHEIYGEHLFTRTSEEEQDQPRGPHFGWWGAYLSVAESGTFGTYDQVLQTGFHTVCVYLVQKKREADEARRRMRNPKAMAL